MNAASIVKLCELQGPMHMEGQVCARLKLRFFWFMN